MAHIRERHRTHVTSYEVRWVECGKHMQKTFHSPEEAQDYAAYVESRRKGEKQLGMKLGILYQSMLFSDASYIESLSPRTVKEYLEIFDGRIMPEFGDRHIGSIQRWEVDSWIGSIAATRSRYVVKKIYNHLKSVFDYAMREGYIDKTPCFMNGYLVHYQEEE